MRAEQRRAPQSRPKVVVQHRARGVPLEDVASTQRFHHRKVGRSAEANFRKAAGQAQALRFVEKIPVRELAVDAKAVERRPSFIQVELVDVVFAQVDMHISDAVSVLPRRVHIQPDVPVHAQVVEIARPVGQRASAVALTGSNPDQTTDDSAVTISPSPPRAPTVVTLIAPKCASGPGMT